MQTWLACCDLTFLLCYTWLGRCYNRPMTASSPTRTWFKARLTPAAMDLFSRTFYPEPNQRQARYVWFTQVAAGSNQKVLVGTPTTAFKILTLQLAVHALEPLTKATRALSSQLDNLSESLVL